MKNLLLILLIVIGSCLTSCSPTGTITQGKPCQIFGYKAKSKNLVGSKSYAKQQRQRAIANARRASRL